MGISTFLGLETALRGIQAHQQALETTGHNITNANTVGYTRQNALMAATPAFQYPPNGQIGTGVEVTQYQRVRDDFLDVQYRAQSMLKGYWDGQQNGLGQVELNLNEPSTTGVNSLLDKFWSSWHDLANNPESIPTRQAVVQSGAALAGGISSLQSQLTTISSQNQTNLTLTVNDLNSTVSSLATIDQGIMTAVSEGKQPSNDLLDQRDVLLDKLGGMVNLSIAKQADGSVTLKVGSFGLLAGGVATPVASAASFGNDPITSQPNLTSGKLAGLVDFGAKLTTYQSQLDTIAGSLITKVNALQTSGYDLNGAATTTPFFTGTDASTIDINATLSASPELLGASNTANAPGNAQNATAIAALRSDVGIGSAYATLVTSIASDSQDAQRNAQNASALSDALDNRRQSISGVSLDEEMTNLLKFQRGFQASSRVLSAMDEMIDTIISRTGRVGL
jgi:flagellar hook-associated protein 1 FlgK